MDPNEKRSVQSYIIRTLNDSFDVIINDPDNPVNIVDGKFFPDVILKNKTSHEISFIIEIRKNGDIAKNITHFKELSELPFTVYIIVPKVNHIDTKNIIEASNLSVKLGYYIYENNLVIDISYE